VDIDVSRDGGQTWEAIASNVVNDTATAGSYSWMVNGPPTTDALIRVVWTGHASTTDQSDVIFTLVDPLQELAAYSASVVAQIAVTR